MEIKTKEFQEAASTILYAAELDKNAVPNLELCAKNHHLYMNVSNQEYYVSVKFELEADENFRAVVDAPTFLNLISGLTTETFKLKVLGNVVGVESGRSNYKLPMIYKNEELLVIDPITLANPTVEMNISNDILKSILNINSKEILKGKSLDISELKKMYYLNEHGCFTHSSGACLNSFELEKPVSLLLHDKIVRLFKLFKEDVSFKYGYDQDAVGGLCAKIVMRASNIYIAAKVTKDEEQLRKVESPYAATISYVKEHYPNQAVVSTNALLAAISRLSTFTKNVIEKADKKAIFATMTVSADEITLIDRLENTEVIQTENTSYSDAGDYSFVVNLVDLKLALDNYKNEHVTINCGNHKAILINHETSHHLLPDIPVGRF